MQNIIHGLATMQILLESLSLLFSIFVANLLIITLLKNGILLQPRKTILAGIIDLINFTSVLFSSERNIAQAGLNSGPKKI